VCRVESVDKPTRRCWAPIKRMASLWQVCRARDLVSCFSHIRAARTRDRLDLTDAEHDYVYMFTSGRAKELYDLAVLL
jgi:hypothetical protein